MPNIPESCNYTINELLNKPWLLRKTKIDYIPYTCVGSRSTPSEMMQLLKHVGRAIAKNGWVVRTGDADGADESFRWGADIEGGFVEVYTAKDQLCHNIGYHTCLSSQAKQVSKDIWNSFANRSNCPRWDSLKTFTKKLMTRNVCQVAGPDLETTSKCLICWTPDGVECGEDTTDATGGTGHTIRIASHFNVPIRNLANNEHKNDVINWAEDELQESLQ